VQKPAAASVPQVTETEVVARLKEYLDGADDDDSRIS
jgi:hypothetical protein